jgi:GNAT superfamily N-acetyltransferase
MHFLIRTALPADVGAMHTLRCSVLENRLAGADRVTIASYLPFLASGSAWVADGDGVILGFAAIDLAAGSLWALFVAPAAEREGIGRALHDHFVAHARRAGLNELVLGTAPGTRAETFYRKAGWREAGLDGSGELRFRLPLNGE